MKQRKLSKAHHESHIQKTKTRPRTAHSHHFYGLHQLTGSAAGSVVSPALRCLLTDKCPAIYPAIQPPSSTSFKSYKLKKPRSDSADDIIIAGETEQVEFVTNEEESRKAAEFGCRCAFSLLFLDHSFFKGVPVVISLHYTINAQGQYHFYPPRNRLRFSNGPSKR